jgi:hypothetical protein
LLFENAFLINIYLFINKILEIRFIELNLKYCKKQWRSMNSFRIFIGSVLFLLTAPKVQAQAVGDYQTAGSGNWNALATWQTWNGTAWVAPGATPTSANGVITILATHTVTITANVTIDEVTVNGALTSSGATPTTIANGASGVDLTINGTLQIIMQRQRML